MTRISPALMAGFIVLISAGCGGSPTEADAASDSASVPTADSLERAATLRADSLRRDSLMRDSIENARALTLTDFVSTGAGAPEYVSEQEIIDRLKAKDYDVANSERVRSSFDPADPDGTDFRTVTNYRFVSEGDPAGTDVSVKWSETYWPVTINFADDRQLERFVASLADAGFEKDGTGNYSHRSNTPVSGVSVVCSGRRVVIERIWSY